MATTRRAWASLAVLMAAYTVSFVDRTILSLLIPPIQQDLGLSDTRVSLLAGFAFALFYTVMGVPLGRVADRWHRRNLIAIGITVWCVMTAACGLARNFWQLFAARVGVGVGEATLSPAAYSMISDLFPREQLGRALAVYSFGLPIGSGLALLIGGFAIGAIEGLGTVTLPGVGVVAPWQLTFLMVGLPGLVVGALVMTMQEPPRRDLASAGARGGAPALVPFLVGSRRVLTHHFGGLAMLVLVVYGTTAWMPTLFIRVHDWPASSIGYAYGLISIACGAAGLFTGGWLADRWWRQGRTDAHLRVALWSAALMTPCFAAAALAPAAGVALALLAVATFASSLHGGVAGAALQIITPNALRGQITAAYFFVANLVGLGIGPTAVALLTDYVYGDPRALGASIATLAVLAGPVSVALLATGLRPYRARVAGQPQAAAP